MANIVPMSGSGSRFADIGYLLPKPLITVSGKPMIMNVIDAMPPAEKWIFIVRKEHIEKYSIDKLIASRIPHAIIIPEEKPWGQAPSCMLAVPYLEPEEDMFIAACDNSFLYNKAKYSTLVKDPTVDAIIWTFTKDELLVEKPEAWGWVKLDEDGCTIKDMSVKVPVSDNPFNDHSVVATFYFKKSKEFVEAYNLMVKENYKINNEFYIDSFPIFYRKMGKRSVIFDVDLYVGWGKPKDLYKYEEKEYFYKYYSKFNINPILIDKLWCDFFSNIIKL